MEIADWLVKNKMSLFQLAKKAKIPPSTLYQAFACNYTLSSKFASKISKATKGQVTESQAAYRYRKQFKDQRGGLNKKTKITCPHCKEEFKAPRGWKKE